MTQELNPELKLQEEIHTSPTLLVHDLDQARKFLALFGKKHTFQTFDDTAAKDSCLARVIYGSLDEHVDTLIDLNNRGAGVYFMVNEGDGILKPGARTCRTNASVTRVRALAVDLDGAPIEPLLNCEPQPHIIVESSPGRAHGYWLVRGVALANFKSLQIAIAKRFDGDSSVCDLARVMRVPGFYHRKGAPFLTRILRIETEPRSSRRSGKAT